MLLFALLQAVLADKGRVTETAELSFQINGEDIGSISKFAEFKDLGANFEIQSFETFFSCSAFWRYCAKNCAKF